MEILFAQAQGFYKATFHYFEIIILMQGSVSWAYKPIGSLTIILSTGL